MPSFVLLVRLIRIERCPQLSWSRLSRSRNKFLLDSLLHTDSDPIMTPLMASSRRVILQTVLGITMSMKSYRLEPELFVLSIRIVFWDSLDVTENFITSSLDFNLSESGYILRH